jgi:amidase
LLKDYVPPEDAIAVARAKSAGAIVIGRTNVPELGLGSHTFNPLFGSTKNAFDVTKSAGGSSGGAAVATALHMLPVVDGSDVMGSLRNPAAWANIYGIRPSLGRVPQWPAQDVWTQHLLTDGPMARTLEDLARMLATQSGPDARCPLSLQPAFDLDEALRPMQTQERHSTRILWLGDMAGYLPLETGVNEICTSALQAAQNKGCQIEYLASRIQLGFAPEQVWQSWLMLRQVLVATKVGALLVNPQNRALIRPEAIWEYEESLKHSANALVAASAVRTNLYLALLKLLNTYDAIALPTAQVWPFDVTMRYPIEITTQRGTVQMDTYHRWMESTIYATMAGLPAISVPVGFGVSGTGKGLAMGMQLIGRPQGDAALLRLATLFAN